MSKVFPLEAVSQVVRSMNQGTSEDDQVWINPVEPCTDADTHQFVAFLKPEATNLVQDVNFTAIFRELLGVFSKNKIEVGAVRVVSGRFFERTDIMAKHYGVINTISRQGESAMSQDAKEALKERFAKEISSGSEVVGGHQFLKEYADFSPFSLSVLFDSLGSVRLAPGTYACTLSVEGRPFILLNGFNPYQLERFTRETAVTVLIEGRSPTAWRVLRGEVAGATNPQKAAPGSFRQILLEGAQEFGLIEVSQNANGLHLSAGPLEGMVELQRFFGSGEEDLPTHSTCFGMALLAAGVAEGSLQRFASNDAFKASDGRMVSSFDLTEEMNASEAVALLRNLVD